MIGTKRPVPLLLPRPSGTNDGSSRNHEGHEDHEGRSTSTHSRFNAEPAETAERRRWAGLLAGRLARPDRTDAQTRQVSHRFTHRSDSVRAHRVSDAHRPVVLRVLRDLRGFVMKYVANGTGEWRCCRLAPHCVVGDGAPPSARSWATEEQLQRQLRSWESGMSGDDRRCFVRQGGAIVLRTRVRERHTV